MIALRPARLAVVALAAFGCALHQSGATWAGSRQVGGQASASTPSRGVDTNTASSRLLSAAEPFEALTEMAFSAQRAQLDRAVVKVERAASQVGALLPPEASSSLNDELANIRSALNSNDRTALALTSIEGYRILVSATAKTRVPKAANLLDCAGFRYDADLKAKPIRWDDMTKAVEFAAQQWSSISGTIADRTLANRFVVALHQMENAATQKNATEAQSAAKSVLDLVDKLEQYFNRA